MKKLSINLDEGVELDIYTKRGRTLHCQIDHDRAISGNLLFTARSDMGDVLALTVSAGITVDNRRITLYVDHDAMQSVPTGIYQYDLVEVSGSRADNLFVGKFIVQPSVTSVP